jgi:uncharacterized membrane protein
VIETSATAEPNAPAFWRAFLVYTGSRVAVFVAVVGLLYGVGVRGLVVIFIALVLSGVLSYFLLDRQRAAFATAVERRVERRVESRRGRTSSRTAREDAIADALIAEAEAEAASGQGLSSGDSRGR